MTQESATNQEQKLSQEQQALHEQAMQLVKRLPAFGPIIMLYLQSAHRRFQFICDLEWLLIAPLMNEQCKLYMRKEYPFAYVSWAFLDEEAERKLILNGGKLRPQDWKSGEHFWLMDIVAPFGDAAKVLADIQQNEFPDRAIRLLVPDPATGGVTRRELKPFNEMRQEQEAPPQQQNEQP